MENFEGSIKDNDKLIWVFHDQWLAQGTSVDALNQMYKMLILVDVL